MRFSPADVLVFSAFALCIAGCASKQLAVPKENQKTAHERYGEQQQMMNGLSQTPSEQAGARHENATVPVERPRSEKQPPRK